MVVQVCKVFQTFPNQECMFIAIMRRLIPILLKLPVNFVEGYTENRGLQLIPKFILV